MQKSKPWIFEVTPRNRISRIFHMIERVISDFFWVDHFWRTGAELFAESLDHVHKKANNITDAMRKHVVDN